MKDLKILVFMISKFVYLSNIKSLYMGSILIGKEINIWFNNFH